MAPISKLIPFLFSTTLLFSLQVNARDSQFFSKVLPIINNLIETEVPNNEGLVNKPKQQPVFIPETENSYGLNGPETGLHPPSTTTTNAAPYTTNTNTYQPHKTTTTGEDTSKYSNNYYYNYKKDPYSTNQNELSDTKYTEGGYNSMENQNNNNNPANERYYYNNNNDDANNSAC